MIILKILQDNAAYIQKKWQNLSTFGRALILIFLFSNKNNSIDGIKL